MRYLILIACNIPIIMLALLNIVTKYKLHKLSRDRFIFQLLLWLGILVVLIGSFPLYNHLQGKPTLDSIDLSSFDIVQTTTIVLLFYVVFNLRQHNEQNERRLRDLHQELSIKISELESKQ